MRNKLFFVDVETTGTNPETNGIWQLAYMIEINGKIKHKGNLLMKPMKYIKIDKEALQHCNINKQELKAFPSQRKQFQKLLKVLNKVVDKYNPSDKLHIVAYNANFDSDFIRSWFTRDNNYNWFDSHFFSVPICTMNLAGIICKNIRNRMINFRLATVVALFKIELVNAHDAKEDNYANYLLYHKLTKYIKTIEV